MLVLVSKIIRCPRVFQSEDKLSDVRCYQMERKRCCLHEGESEAQRHHQFVAVSKLFRKKPTKCRSLAARPRGSSSSRLLSAHRWTGRVCMRFEVKAKPDDAWLAPVSPNTT